MDEQRTHNTRKVVGSNIRRLREAQGMSLRKFALMIGVSYPYLSNVETGKQSPTIDVLDRVAQGLDIDIRELF